MLNCCLLLIVSLCVSTTLAAQEQQATEPTAPATEATRDSSSVKTVSEPITNHSKKSTTLLGSI
jgi:uncharacterized protein YdeI (BOF family)